MKIPVSQVQHDGLNDNLIAVKSQQTDAEKIQNIMKDPDTNCIENVEGLVSLLAEAAEVEHGFMCSYLYAAYSMRTNDQTLPEEQRTMIQSWHKQIIGVAVEEMTHLALVSNLLVAIGFRPHFKRQNFPVAPGVHPAGISVGLQPFSMDTLDHFIFLERPDTVDVEDPQNCQNNVNYERDKPRPYITPRAYDYDNIGDFYRDIQATLVRLSQKLGEDQLFCGGILGQVGPEIMPLSGIMSIQNLTTALKAIDHIIEQGEGASADSEHCHYRTYLNIKQQYQEQLDKDPTFNPAYPAARNPVMREPVDYTDRVFINHVPSARVLDLANGLYNHMIRCLVTAFGHMVPDREDKQMLLGASMQQMHLISSLAQQLVQMPANDSMPNVNAGMTFSTLKGYEAYIVGVATWRNIKQRFKELADGMRDIQDVYPNAAQDAAKLDALMQQFATREQQPDPTGTEKTGQIIEPTEPLKRPDPKDNPNIEVAEGKDITIEYELKRCIHSRFCVLEAPNVFLANTPGKWIYPDSMKINKLVAVAEQCVSGAIQYRRHDGEMDEVAPTVNFLNVRENGPNAVRGELYLKGEPMGARMTLCRCGHSKNKPFCDNTHMTIGFTATGEPAAGDLTPLTVRNGPLHIDPQPNGPNKVTGNLELCQGTGHPFGRTTSTLLCRCGGSQNKPYCDGTHKKIGFEAP